MPAFPSTQRVRRALMGSLLLSTALAGCAMTPDLGAAPQLNRAEQYASTRSFEAPKAEWPSDRWWESYGDAQLNGLIEEALSGSPTLEAAAARVRQARAFTQQAGAARYPTLGAEASAQSVKQSMNGVNLPENVRSMIPGGWDEQGRAALTLNYQLDFFGRNRSAFAAATSQAEAAEAEAAAARLQLSTAIALAYADLSRLFSDRDAAEAIVRLRQDSAALVKQRFEAGLENEGQFEQAQAELAQSLGDLVALEGAVARTRNSIAALMGKGPDRGLDIQAPQQPKLAQAGLPEKIGADLIGRRPDLAAARLRAEAAAKNVDVAKAEFYPNVDLVAVIGLQSLGLGALAEGDSRFGQVGPAVSLPIFSGGRLRGNLRGKRSEYDLAVAEYNQALADALREVADAIADRRTLDAQLVHERNGLASAEKSYRIARQRYEAGLVSYIDVLTIENGLVAQRRAVAGLEAQAFAQDVAMVRALGGGFVAA